MAARNIVIPKVMNQQSSSNTVPQTSIDLDDETKRWAVVGIAMTNVLVPALKNYIDKKLSVFYNLLVKTYQINKKESKLFEPVKVAGFNYRNQNDYIITSHHDLAKFYLPQFMTKFKSITDDDFDASAAFSIISSSFCFSPTERDWASKIRSQVRNEWAHCNISSWDQLKFLECFKLMTDLAGALPKQIASQVEATQNKWKEDELKLMGRNVEISLLKKIVKEFNIIVPTLVLDKVDIHKFEVEAKKINEAAAKVETRLVTLESDYLSLKNNIVEHDTRLKELEATKKTSTASVPIIPNRNSYFIGRQAQLQNIKDALTAPGQNKAVAICGLGGVGKTSLAIQAVYENEESFPGGVYWLTADSSRGDSMIKASLFSLGKTLGIVDNETEESRLASIVIDHLQKKQKRFLLVIDNFDSIEMSVLARKLVSGSWIKQSPVFMILTSRLDKENFPKLATDPFLMDLKSFELEEGVDFLRKRTERVHDEMDAREVVLELGGLPLALDQAAAYLKASKEKLPNYLKKLRKKKLKILDKSQALSPTDDIEIARLAFQTTWGMNMDSIEEEMPMAKKVTFVLAFLSPRGIPRTIINQGSPKLENYELAEALEDDVDEMLLCLSKLSLFDRMSDDTLSVHRLVQEIIKEEINEAGVLQETLQNVQRMLAYSIENEEKPEDYMNQPVVSKEENSWWNVAALRGWGMIMENIDHFLQELDNKECLLGKTVQNNQFVMLIDHAILYFFVMNQIDTAAKFSEVLNYHLSKLSSEPSSMYKPKFPLSEMSFQRKEIVVSSWCQRKLIMITKETLITKQKHPNLKETITSNSRSSPRQYKLTTQHLTTIHPTIFPTEFHLTCALSTIKQKT